MAYFYKRFELSQSLNGSQLVQIARNPAGMVVFREDSEKKLKAAIDKFYEDKERDARIAAKTKTNQAKAKKPAVAPVRLTKTADSKFISNSQLEKSSPPRKKTFWS